MSQAKENAAMAALDFVEDGMTLGLGSGSTAEIFLERLGERIAGGLKVQGIPTPDKVESIQLTIDGADEVDPQFSLIKGGGACLLREKIIAHASDRMVVIVDQSKMVETLGNFPLPIEVDPFGMALTAEAIYAALMDSGCENAQTVLRQKKDGSGPLITDGGHYILDSRCRKIPKPHRRSRSCQGYGVGPRVGIKWNGPFYHRSLNGRS